MAWHTFDPDDFDIDGCDANGVHWSVRYGRDGCDASGNHWSERYGSDPYRLTANAVEQSVPARQSAPVVPAPKYVYYTLEEMITSKEVQDAIRKSLSFKDKQIREYQEELLRMGERLEALTSGTR